MENPVTTLEERIEKTDKEAEKLIKELKEYVGNNARSHHTRWYILIFKPAILIPILSIALGVILLMLAAAK